jgi:hypothetical protein
MKWLVAQQNTTRRVCSGHVHRGTAATAPTIRDLEACPRFQRLHRPPASSDAARGENSTGCDVTGLDLPRCTAPLSLSLSRAASNIISLYIKRRTLFSTAIAPYHPLPLPTPPPSIFHFPCRIWDSPSLN